MLVKPEFIKQYMFGSIVESDWKQGSGIIFKGVWQGRPFEDKGNILQIEPLKKVQYSHFNTMSGLPDIPENYNIVMIELSQQVNGVLLTLKQDNNETEEEQRYSEENWGIMIGELKKIAEK
jgi:hypothetical protein